MNKNVKIAYVFPGQGSQEIGMGLQLFEKYGSIRMLYTAVDRFLGFSLSQLCFSGPLEELTRTINVQPAILLTSIACFQAAMEIASNGLPEAAFLAGHSVGEYSALVASKSLHLEDAIRLTRERGRLMHEAGEQNPGGMMAILGAEKSAVEELCTETNLEISNFNAPGQIVVSGINADLAKARDTRPNKGIKKIVPLNVSGAFHSRWMLSASKGLKNYMPMSIFTNPEIPVISNVDSNPLTNTQEIRDELVAQIIKPVQWQRSIENMLSYGVNTFVEIGHGQVIAGLIRRIRPEVRVFNIGDANIETQVKDLEDYVYNT